MQSDTQAKVPPRASRIHQPPIYALYLPTYLSTTTDFPTQELPLLPPPSHIRDHTRSYTPGVQKNGVKMSILSNVTQKMNQLRLEADESAAKVEEMQAKVKQLEQDNLAKEQEITSLSHKNGLLETEVEKLETAIKDFKKAAEDGTQHSSTNEALTRRLQLLEEEAEEADKTLREANEKYVEVPLTYNFKSEIYLTWRCLPFALFPCSLFHPSCPSM